MLRRLIWAIGLLLVTLSGRAQSTRQDSIRISEITHDSTRIIKWARLGLKVLYDRAGSYHEALPYLERAETEAKEARSVVLLNHVMQLRGELEWVAGHWPVALRLFQQAERTYTQLAVDDKVNAASMRHLVLLTKLRIGQVQTDNNDFAQVRQSLTDALRYARDQRLFSAADQRLVASTYNSLSILEGKLKNQEKSLAYADTAALLSRAAGDDNSYYVALLNTAITRKNLKQYAAAVRQYESCAAYFAKEGDSYALTMVYANLPRALLGLKRYDEGISYAQKALAMSGNTTDRLMIHSDVHEALSELYEAKGDLGRALSEFRLSKAQQDTLFTRDKEKQMQEVTAKYEAERKEVQIQELKKTSEQRTWQLAGLGIGSVLLALLLGLSLHQSKRLRQGSQRIRRQTDQLQLLMKELHHRAKNNLAIVSGLLELQANRTEDRHIRQAFREGQQRINAMSLIHQRLYQTSELTGIDLREYISNLVQSLMKTYGQNASVLDLHLSLDADIVEADVAIPLGLIINEVLTNAFKYAFQNVPRPFLSVTLEMKGERLLLQIVDNGPGLDLHAWNAPGGSFGKQLIRSLSNQLDAHLTIDNQQGTYIRLDVPISLSIRELSAA